MNKPVLLFALAALAGCAPEGSLLLVDVTATAPLDAGTLEVAVMPDHTPAQTLTVPVPGGQLTSLSFGHDVLPGNDNVALTLSAAGQTASRSVAIAGGEVVHVEISIGPGAMPPPMVVTAQLDGVDVGTATAWLAVLTALLILTLAVTTAAVRQEAARHAGVRPATAPSSSGCRPDLPSDKCR